MLLLGPPGQTTTGNCSEARLPGPCTGSTPPDPGEPAWPQAAEPYWRRVGHPACTLASESVNISGLTIVDIRISIAHDAGGSADDGPSSEAPALWSNPAFEPGGSGDPPLPTRSGMAGVQVGMTPS